MSESISSPWIRDYLSGVAETYGAQFYNAPVSSTKRKVQLTDFLTYQENSYVWAWISDKEYRVSVRISKDAVDLYKSYRPMFSPRPLGPNATGNTPVSHISLEIGHVKSVGVGAHLFGNPRDVESDENLKEWVVGLRQDGGGGNVLKLRKQQELVQNKKAPPPPPPPPPPLPFPVYAPVSQCPATKAVEDTAKPKPEQPQDSKRTYVKRWRIIELNSWKFSSRPATKERPRQTESGHTLVEPHLDTTSRLESSCHREPLVCPPSPHRTPSPTSRLQRQGTPSDWSPSIRGSQVAPDDEPEVLPTTPHPEGHTTMDTAFTSDTRSLQPPTPAQRIRHSLPRFTSPPRSSPEVFARSSPLPSQQLPCSSPPPPSSSLSHPLPPLPAGTSIRKNIQRKVPHPGVTVSRSDPTKQGSVQILVPNSDTSGTGSSQSYSQSQQFQRQLLSHPPALPSSLAKDFEPPDASTPREGKPGNSSRRTSKMFAESLPTHCDIDEQEIASTNDKHGTENPEKNKGKKQGSDSTRPPAPSAPRIEVLEVGTSDTEEEIDQLQLTCSTARTKVDFNTQTGTQDTGERDADADRVENQLSVDEVERHSPPQSSPPRQPLCQPAPSVIQHPSSDERDTDGVSVHRFHRRPERPESRSSMHSLFSDSLDDERTISSHPPTLPVSRTEVKVQEKVNLVHVPTHDSEAWKAPSFLTRNKGKGKARAVEEPDASSATVGKKRAPSAQLESPVAKRAKVAALEPRRVASGQTTAEIMQHQDIEASAIVINSSIRHSTSTNTTTRSTAFQPKPRLANFVVDFEKINLGKGVPMPMVDVDNDIKGILVRTGRIRKLGKEAEENGRVYLMS
ncbi:hypothetical protein OG21DRAFT_1603650 [Imleria badia]|nr:hypothetical protein OG21DRAFT_1603650 [Imleria badia]